MKLFEIDDGSLHTVAAHDEAEAFGLYIENIIKSGCYWPSEKPAISVMDPSREYTLHPDGGELKVRLAVHEWLNLYAKPQYVGCSDF